MQAGPVLELLRRQPFLAFDIRTIDAGSYKVDSPEFISITRDYRTLLYQTPEEDRTVRIELASIVSIEIPRPPGPRLAR